MHLLACHEICEHNLFSLSNYERFSLNKIEVSLKCNQGILYRFHENNVEMKALRAPKRSIIIIVETNISINKHENQSLHNWLHVESNTIKELKSFFISSEDINKAPKVCKELSEPIKDFIKKPSWQQTKCVCLEAY